MMNRRRINRAAGWDSSPYESSGSSDASHPTTNKYMNQTESQFCSLEAHRSTHRNRMLMYGFVVSIIGLPVGILLRLPVVWGLAIVGIVIGGIKILLRRSGG